MTQRFYFDLWPQTDYTGTATGELTEAFDRKYRAADQSIGSGEFAINRHSPQADWCTARALVRVRLVPGGPFAYDDPRYIGGFFIETSDDVALSTDEEGGEVLTRGGPQVVALLKRAINYPNANITGHRSYWSQAKITGDIVFPDKTVGEAFRSLVLNAMQRTGNLPGLTIDFTLTHDSSGTPWPDSDTDWRFPVGMDLLTALSKVVSSKTYYRMGPDLLLQVFEDHPGDDLSGTVVFTKGVDVSEVSSKNIDAGNFFSRALVRGEKADNQLTYLQVADTSVEAVTGRVEGYVEYQTTPTTARLTRAGQQAIDKAKLQQDGPVTSGVYSGFVPFVDYREGDIVTVDIPGVYDADEVRIAAITLSEVENGEYDVIHEYQAVPFDPSTGPDNFASSNDAPPGGSGTSPRTCGDCPSPGPFVPPTDGTALVDVTLEVGSAIFVGQATDRERHYASELGITSPPLVVGRQYRLVVDVLANGAPGSPYAPDDIQSGPFFNIADPDGSLNVITQGGGFPGLDWTPDNGTNTSALTYGFNGLSFNVVGAGAYATGSHIEGEWLTLTADGGSTIHADVNLRGTPLSGYWGFYHRARVQLQHREGNGDPIIGEGQDSPIQGQVVGETASDAPVAGIYTTNYPYVAGSLRVYVSGVLVNSIEVDNTAGTWRFPDGFDPGTGTITYQYQALNSTATGATNGPWSPTSSPVPPSLLPAELFEDDKWKQPVRVATTANITIATALNAGDTIDGVTLADGDRVLVKDQSTASGNGVYIAGTTPTRATDFDDDDEVAGAFVFVLEGTANGGTLWYSTNTDEPDVGTDPIDFDEFSPSVAIDFGEDADISTLDFGDVPDAGATGEVADAGHVHGMPAAPDPADDTSVWMPLTTTNSSGDPELVWDGDDSLIPTLTPLS